LSQHYFWIPVTGGVRRREVINPPDHSTLWRSHIMKFTLEVCENSMVHVGSGRFSIHNGRPLSLNVRISGHPVIPGSTLKGAVSHYYMAVVGDNAKASKLFGWAGYMSRIFFSDAKADRDPVCWGVDPSWEPRRRDRGVKLYRTDIPLRTVDDPVQYVEAFPPGTRFETQAVIINADRNEIPEILLALGVTPAGAHSLLLGFGRPKGMGKVIVVLNKLRISEVDQLGSEKEVTQEAMSLLEGAYGHYKTRFKEVFGVGQV